MFKALAKLEIEIEGRVYSLLCDHDSPIVHVKDALVKFVSHAVKIEEEAIAAMAAASSVVEEVKEVIEDVESVIDLASQIL